MPFPLAMGSGGVALLGRINLIFEPRRPCCCSLRTRSSATRKRFVTLSSRNAIDTVRSRRRTVSACATRIAQRKSTRQRGTWLRKRKRGSVVAWGAGLNGQYRQGRDIDGYSALCIASRHTRQEVQKVRSLALPLNHRIRSLPLPVKTTRTKDEKCHLWLRLHAAQLV